MRINSLTLKDFRNYSDETVKFSPYTNIIYGNNAQGKTNLLEAVYMFSQGKSCRANSDKEVIKFGSGFAVIKSDFSNSERDFSAAIRINRNEKKKIFINNVAISKLSMLLTYFNAVMFSPEDLELVKGAPGIRRKFVDTSISQLYPNYLSTLIDYSRILKEKNSLLKDLRFKNMTKDAMLSVWNVQLAEKAETITAYRHRFFDDIAGFVSDIHKNISNENLFVKYCPNVEENILQTLENNQKREIENGSAMYGSHRDDIDFIINEKTAKLYASQGQQRTIVLSVKLALTEYINYIKDEYPVLLLDDIMSELDIKRRTFLSEKITDKQVLITCTDADIVRNASAAKLIYVSEGTVKY